MSPSWGPPPRVWGSSPRATAAGVVSPRVLRRIGGGGRAGPQPPVRHIYMRNLGKDLQWFVRAAQHPHPLVLQRPSTGDLLALLRPVLGIEQWDLFRWREPQMWWRLTAQAFRPALTRLTPYRAAVTPP